MQIDDLPPLRDVIASHGLDAKKSLGKTFYWISTLHQKLPGWPEISVVMMF